MRTTAPDNAVASVVQVLRLARQQLNVAARRAAENTDLSRMAALLAAQTAVEITVRLAHDAVAEDGKEDPSIDRAEKAVFGWTSSRGFSRPVDMTALRRSRNLVAHSGMAPTSTDLVRHLKVANIIVAELALAVWEIDVARVTFIDVVRSTSWRRWLRNADQLLSASDFVPILDDGTSLSSPPTTPEDRGALGVAFVRMVWMQTVSAAGWSYPEDDPPDFHADHHANPRVAQQIWEGRMEAERRMRSDVLALAIGVVLPDVRRFEATNYARISGSDQQKVWTVTGRPPPTEDARFAVDFVVDWVLRVEQHIPEPHDGADG